MSLAFSASSLRSSSAAARSRSRDFSPVMSLTMTTTPSPDARGVQPAPHLPAVGAGGAELEALAAARLDDGRVAVDVPEAPRQGNQVAEPAPAGGLGVQAGQPRGGAVEVGDPEVGDPPVGVALGVEQPEGLVEGVERLMEAQLALAGRRLGRAGGDGVGMSGHPYLSRPRGAPLEARAVRRGLNGRPSARRPAPRARSARRRARRGGRRRRAWSRGPSRAGPAGTGGRGRGARRAATGTCRPSRRPRR